MIKKIFIGSCGIVVGFFIGYLIITYNPSLQYDSQHLLPKLSLYPKQVIGFLPYWLIGKAQLDYSQYITTLTYFGLTIDTDGSILRLTNPQEADPGWNSLTTDKLSPFLTAAKKKNLNLSLLVFNGDSDAINTLMSDPIPHAQNLIKDVIPVMHQYGFTDLNLDIESTNDASDEARMHFSQFVTEVKKGLDGQNLTLTVEISPSDLIKKHLIHINDFANSVDHVVLMAYDYHYAGSYVSGPVAPLFGAGTSYEFDTDTAIYMISQIIPAKKIILGVPLYGYAWETIDNTPRSGVIPGTGIVESSNTVEQLLQSCATCSAHFDTNAQESYVIYQDQDTGTYHQVYYPDKEAISTKVDYAESKKLGGIALWALGYEGDQILTPLVTYKKWQALY